MQSKIDSAVKTLLELKAQFKSATGNDWKPGVAIPVPKSSSDEAGLLSQISEQGEKVRKIKADKAPKVEIDAAVKVLLELKAEYKKVTGKDWKPGAESTQSPAAANSSHLGNDISSQINQQGDKVRKLKADKAAKTDIDAAVKLLLDLKAKFKAATGQDWKPGQPAVAPSQFPALHAPGSPLPASTAPASPTPAISASSGCDRYNELLEKITHQGEKVRTIKTAKADKSTIDSEVKVLLALKGEFKAVTGIDWKPDLKPTVPALTAASAQSDISNLSVRIAEQGDKVRKLKSGKAGKSVVDSEVKVLLSLKTEYKGLTGSDWKPVSVPVSVPVCNSVPTEMAENKVESLTASVNEQGEKVRQLKASGASKVGVH